MHFHPEIALNSISIEMVSSNFLYYMLDSNFILSIVLVLG